MPPRPPSDDVESFLPLPTAVFHILVALADRDRHGYSIMQDVDGAHRRQGAAQRRHALQRHSPHAGAGPDRGTARQPGPRQTTTSGGAITASHGSAARWPLAEARRVNDMLAQARATGLIPRKLCSHARRRRLSRAALVLSRSVPARVRRSRWLARLPISCATRGARPAGGPKPPIWAGTLVDLLPTAFREHLNVIRQDLRHARPHPRRQPRLHGRRRAVAGARHRRQHRDLQPAEQRPDEHAAGAAPHELVMLTDPGHARACRSAPRAGERSLADLHRVPGSADA